MNGRKIQWTWGLALLLLYIFSCSDESPYKQGKKLYTLHCANCHMDQGEGLGALYPPLNQSDYLAINRNDLPCLIRNGLKGEILVNGLVYDLEMPGIPQLTEVEINNLLNYIFTAWDNELEPLQIKEVQKTLSTCPVKYPK
jgi:cytochrome c551